MRPRLFSDLARWWPVMSAPEDYSREAGAFRDVLEKIATRPVRTLLELGCGGGNHASHLKRWYDLTLLDRSPEMLAVSRALNPGCEHVLGDMREARLGRTFDAVLIYDAIMYLTTEEDLHAALATAHAHCAPGGVALFAPDDTTETWRPGTETGGHDVDGRSLRYLEWTFDPHPGDTEFTACYAFLLREGDGPVRVESDEHRLGLFPRATWLEVLREVGFTSQVVPCRGCDWRQPEVFVGLRGA